MAASAGLSTEDQNAAALAAFGGIPFAEHDDHTGEHVSDRDDGTDSDVYKGTSADDMVIEEVRRGVAMKQGEVVVRSAGGSAAVDEEVRRIDAPGSAVKRGFQPGDKAYSAAVPSTAATPAGAPPIPPYPYFLKYSHQEVTGANYDTVFKHVVALLRAAKTRMSVKQDAGRIACHLYDDRANWVQFKVRFFGLPSDDVEGDPHFAVEFDRQQGNAFLLENVYRLTMIGLNAAGMELHGQCRSAQQVLGRGPALPETEEAVAPPVMERGISTGSAGEATSADPADALEPLMEMMQGEWADASEEALGSLARLASDDASGRAKAAIAKQPGLVALLLAMASG